MTCPLLEEYRGQSVSLRRILESGVIGDIQMKGDYDSRPFLLMTDKFYLVFLLGLWQWDVSSFPISLECFFIKG